ncbi:LysR family transcriptional regulator [Massilia sp. Root133]|uniref:LysR family transcriptional regulator n=1 Tax=unclassified Massilia TaxID=2609279 RepID=UPI0006F85ED6|nr:MULTISPECIES: LysR family transcriptional regulator [unclassified Massilia]KQY01378.1 LysR family transcriptional regulator [Massilia sp. Root133]KQZ48364.1 LysR family transcriptional regulator [Massilia sp. Root1485]
MDWNDLKYFLEVARGGSLTRAADVLRVSQSTVSRRIAELEARLSTRLFARHQTGYHLTDEGRELLGRAEAVEDNMLAFERGASGLSPGVSGLVRLATSDNLASDLVIPALPRFVARHPQLRLEIVTTTAAVELGRRDADLALRLVRPSHGNLKARRLGAMSYGVYGHRDYLARHPAPADDPLAGRAMITWDEAHAHLPAAQWLVKRAPEAHVVLAVSTLRAQIAAARAGLGLAIIPDFLVTDPDLVRVLAPGDVFSDGVWLVLHADLAASSRVRAVADFLAETVDAARAALAGEA